MEWNSPVNDAKNMRGELFGQARSETVVFEQEGFISPISNYERDCGDEIQHWKST